MGYHRFLRHSGLLLLSLLALCAKVIILAFFVLLFLLPAAGAFGKEKDSACIALLVDKCRECHYMTRICQSLDKKSKWAWKRTIRTMVKRGAQLSRMQEEQILNCLSSKAADVVAFCENPPPLESLPPLKYPDGVKKKP